MNNRDTIRVGLVGAGYVSAHHLRALKGLPGVEVVGIADLDFERAQQAANRFGVPAAFRTLAEMAQVKPAVIHVLTPPSSHCPVTIEALQMGCHVFVEKPMAETVEECDRMIATAKRVGRVLSVNHSARFDPVVLKAVDLVEGGAIGTVLGVDFLRSSDYTPHRGGPNLPAHFRKGSYPFQDLGIHGYAIFEAFLGAIQDTEVRFNSTGADPNLLFDEWRALARCERGIGQMYLSWNVRPIRNEVLIHGTRGIIHLDCFLQTCLVTKTLPGPKFASAVVGAVTNSLKLLWRVPLNVLRFATGKLSGAPGIHVSIRKFYEALLHRDAVPVSGEEGRRLIGFMEESSRAADAAKESARAAALESLPPRNALVTGAGGLVGKALVRRLISRSESVRVLVRRPVKEWQSDPRIQMVIGDLGDPEIVDHAAQGVDAIYHVGAAMKGCAEDFERGTVWGTRNVIESCLRHNVRRLVHVSSLSVLDHAGHAKGMPVREDSPYEPHPELRGAYTQTKLEAEHMVLAAIRERGLAAVVVRPGQILGPSSHGVAPSGTIALAGRWIVVGSGRARLPLVFVEDVIDALMLAGEKPEAVGQVFNLVDHTPITQREYIAWCRKITPGKVRALYVPGWLLYFAGWTCEVLAKMLGRGLPLSRYRVSSIRPLYPFDVSAAQRGLGWTPAIGVRDGLQSSGETTGAAPLMARTAARP